MSSRNWPNRTSRPYTCPRSPADGRVAVPGHVRAVIADWSWGVTICSGQTEPRPSRRRPVQTTPVAAVSPVGRVGPHLRSDRRPGHGRSAARRRRRVLTRAQRESVTEEMPTGRAEHSSRLGDEHGRPSRRWTTSVTSTSSGGSRPGEPGREHLPAEIGSSLTDTLHRRRALIVCRQRYGEKLCWVKLRDVAGDTAERIARARGGRHQPTQIPRYVKVSTRSETVTARSAR